MLMLVDGPANALKGHGPLSFLLLLEGHLGTSGTNDERPILKIDNRVNNVDTHLQP